MSLYAQLMEEAKSRLTAIDGAVKGESGLPVLFVREFCYLQLRMPCEAIALGCLVAHAGPRRDSLSDALFSGAP
jgi:hypothetical protein